MKILQINSTVNRGSTGRIAEQVGALIQKEGWQSIIAYGRNSNQSTSKLYRISNNFDVIRHGFKSLILGKHALGSAAKTLELIKFINKEKIDLVHLHNLHGYYLNIKVLFNELSKLDVKIVWTFHDCWAFTGHCTYFSDIDCIRWKTKCYACPKKKNYPRSLFFDTSEYFYDLKRQLFNSLEINIVTVSNWLKNLVQNSFLSKHPVITIHNGVDENIFVIQGKSAYLIKKYNLENKIVLLAVSTSWAKQKGFDDYIRLSKILSKEKVIILLGLPQKLIRKLPENVIGIPRTENLTELTSWYATADIVLNLSHQESFGLTSVEGFMCGKPTIVYDTTASPELIIEPSLGKVATKGNIHEINYLIDEIIELKTQPHRIREIAIKHYSANTQYQKYIELYKKLLYKIE
jgi:glycosyltransferase involved in cell wall biosynthesis